MAGRPPQTRTVDQLPPHNIEAEEAFLGSILLWGCESNDRFLPLSELVKPSDFFREKNAWVYQAMLDLLREGMAVDQITVAYKLSQQQKLDVIGGPSYMYRLLNAVATSMHIDTYAQIILDCSRRRQLIATASQIASDAYSGIKPPTPNAQEILDKFGEL